MIARATPPGYERRGKRLTPWLTGNIALVITRSLDVNGDGRAMLLSQLPVLIAGALIFAICLVLSAIELTFWQIGLAVPATVPPLRMDLTPILLCHGRAISGHSADVGTI
jgi:hypothetical protein